jgi:hypothetical protein
MSRHEDESAFTGDAAAVKRESARRTRRSFLAGGVAAAAGAGAAWWINSGRIIGRQPLVLRRTFQADAEIFRTIFAERGLAPTYPLSRARELRLNGTIGMDQELALDSWRLQLAGVANAQNSPRYVKDVTAWEYQYAGDLADTQASNDVKTAPGNGDRGRGSDDDDDDDKTPGKDGSAPSTATSSSTAPPATPAAKGKVTQLNPTGAVDSAAGAAMAARFQAMAQGLSPKRRQGDDEAGPSYSSLDIGTPGLLLTMDDLKQLPKVEFVTQFKCIEGWSEIVQWGGVRLRDLIDMYPPETINGRDPKYVYMETPDGNYYGGYDMTAARHPQSLLVMEMSGQPLTQHHGAPLRLHMPIKYGYKQLKRIGLIAYTNTRPDDYWTKLGYDWYAGL